MASTNVSVTEVLTDQQYNKIIECDSKIGLRKNIPRQDPGQDKTQDAALKVDDYYYEALPKRDPKFLTPIRRWEKRMGFETPIRWINVFIISIFHILSTTFPLLEFYRGLRPKWQSVVFEFFCGGACGFGVTAGVHRYWTHRSFKAKLPLKIIFIILFAMSGQNTIFEWVRDHRVHHKMSETSADPHDARRGFFFSHVGWLLMKKHPLVVKEGNKLDMSDIVNDPVVKFHTKFFMVFKIFFCLILPTIMKVVIWNECWKMAIVSTFVRYMLSLHFTWAVNSFAHLWGNKPYDVNIMPSENWKVSIFSMGEGWHNYHHTFPWDYKAAELSYFLNLTTFYLDLFARIGWAYDLKKASPKLIESVVQKRGHIINDKIE